ncbi:Uncharacterised protein [Slackia heliotrinireducens]|uniref:Uncharacterized protein n=1 Tax=Slackia heliotrinireducens (strain ATCC 29202 / DSM 20476 / NCTC 11029 / RHS 1) TaxID=471855 RepID=C7N421_SLAHD|nr:hypothetical protein [Slackia heliotrinireducens]ACV23757.1 hypothetical protein Shel_27600 [Slackia heliotrinireducens DSM 20476]VEH03381.1 Uncharacterised protein [Slackia heliotrinireducens]
MHEDYTVQHIIDTFSLSNPDFTGIIIAFAIANAIGLLEYAWAVALSLKENKTPFPAWCHAFMFAHDLTAGIVFATLAFQHHFFWLFVVYGLGMLTWTCLEAINIRTVIKYEKEEAFGIGVSTRDAVIALVLMVAFFLCVVNILRWNMNDVAMFYWLPLTNVVMAVAPGYVLAKRRSREGSSVMVYIFVVIGTVFNFMPAPIGLFTSTTPWIYNQPIWFAVGAVCTVTAVYNLYRILQLPPKTIDMGTYKKKPIW